ncbi:MAG TPA: hypothetical protein VGP08_19880 [Pyrinomonadaceae bacterium]|nr:hypothetical protein [Pyrinomonadaceae bacterium]
MTRFLFLTGGPAPSQSGDYRKATQRVYHAPGQASFVELPLVSATR